MSIVRSIVKHSPWVIVPTLIGGAIRSDDRELRVAQGRGIQMGQSGYFNDYDSMMAHAAENNTPIHKRYAGTDAMDWLKTAGLIGGSVFTGSPLITLGTVAWALDKQKEKEARAQQFKRYFEENLK